MLGKDSDLQPVTISGGTFESLSQWNTRRLKATAFERTTSDSSAISSALSTPNDTATPEQG